MVARERGQTQPNDIIHLYMLIRPPHSCQARALHKYRAGRRHNAKLDEKRKGKICVHICFEARSSSTLSQSTTPTAHDARRHSRAIGQKT